MGILSTLAVDSPHLILALLRCNQPINSKFMLSIYFAFQEKNSTLKFLQPALPISLNLEVSEKLFSIW